MLAFCEASESQLKAFGNAVVKGSVAEVLGRAGGGGGGEGVIEFRLLGLYKNLGFGVWAFEFML